jgi:hypothetical protein
MQPNPIKHGSNPLDFYDTMAADGPVAALERRLPLFDSQRLPTTLGAADASNVETRSNLLTSYLWTSLEGRSTRSVGRESFRP